MAAPSTGPGESDAKLSKSMACMMRKELVDGVSRYSHRPLELAERRQRIAALRTYVMTLAPRYQRALREELEGFERSIEELKTQSAVQHAAVQERAAANHSEALEQFAGLHAKLDEASGIMQPVAAFAALLSDGTVPALKEGQTMLQRTRQLQNAKRALDIELSNCRDLAEQERRETYIRQRTDGAAMQLLLTGSSLDSLPVDEAKVKLAEFKQMNRQIEKGFDADLRARRAEEAKEAAKARAAAKAAAKAAPKAKGTAKGTAKGKARAKSAVASGDASSVSSGASSSASAAAPGAASSVASSTAVASSTSSSDTEDESVAKEVVEADESDDSDAAVALAS
jgi:hypothetical protein